MTRLPWEPLERYVAASGDRRFTGYGGTPIPSADADTVASAPWLASMLGVDRRRIPAYRSAGTITLLVAERLCDHIRVHPSEVWGAAYYAALPDVGVEDPRTLRYRLRRDAMHLQRVGAS